MAIVPTPRWRRWRLDFVLLAAAAIAEVIALRSGAFDAPIASVSAGEAVSLPSHLLLAPLIAWLGGVLLVGPRRPGGSPRGFPCPVAALRSRGPRDPDPQPAATGRGRSPPGSSASGLVVAFGVSLAMFAATYDAAKAADARFVVGSDLRITPSVLSRTAPPARLTRPSSRCPGWPR